MVSHLKSIDFSFSTKYSSGMLCRGIHLTFYGIWCHLIFKNLHSYTYVVNTFYQVKMTKLYNVQKTNLTFIGKIEVFNKQL